MSRYDDRRRLHVVEEPRPTMRVITDEESRQIAEDPTVRRILTFTGVLGDVLIAIYRIGCTPAQIDIRPYPPAGITPMHHVTARLTLLSDVATSTLASIDKVRELAHHLSPHVYVFAQSGDEPTAVYTITMPEGTIAVIAAAEGHAR
jgi:hypothetical protein